MNLNSTDTGSIRKFGCAAFFFFGALFGLGIWHKNHVAMVLFGSLTLLGVGFMLFPGPLEPVYGAWVRIARWIGKINTVILLTLLYYLLITPVALVRRIKGGRLLPLEPDGNASSYWRERETPVQPEERFLKRY